MRKTQRETRSPKPCEECGNVFNARKSQKYCSSTCGSIGARRRTGKYPERRTVECARCGTKIVTGKSWQRFCSRECATADYNKKWKDLNVTDRRLNTATVGAISEWLVAIDLLTQGYDVYKSVSPACCCDLAVVKNGKFLRIEVTTAYYGPSGRRLSARKNDYDKYDIVAHVIKTQNRIEYEPSLPE